MSLRAAAASGGGTGNAGIAPFPGNISGNWYAPYLSTNPVAGSTAASTALTLLPRYIPQRTTISELGARIATASPGNAMLGIYAHNALTGKPTGAVLASVIGLGTATAANVSAVLSSNVVLDPGFYWDASEIDNAGAAFTSYSAGGIQMNSIVGSGVSLANVTFASTLAWQVTNTYGSFPDLTAASFTEVGGTKGAIIFHRVA